VQARGGYRTVQRAQCREIPYWPLASHVGAPILGGRNRHRSPALPGAAYRYGGRSPRNGAGSAQGKASTRIEGEPLGPAAHASRSGGTLLADKSFAEQMVDDSRNSGWTEARLARNCCTRERQFLAYQIEHDRPIRLLHDAPVDFAPRAQIEDAERRLYELAESGRYDGGFQRFSQAMKIALDMAANAYLRDGRLSGIATGLRDLDAKMGGLQSSDLIIVAGTLLLYITETPMHVIPTVLGKVTTLAQLLYLALVLVLSYLQRDTDILLPLLIAMLMLTVISGLQYVFRGIRAYNPDLV